MVELAQIGVTGLAVMGRNLARNFARHGYRVAIHNRPYAKTQWTFATSAPSQGARPIQAGAAAVVGTSRDSLAAWERGPARRCGHCGRSPGSTESVLPGWRG
jgi:hypothetical protein